jgi:hypothetical protein
LFYTLCFCGPLPLNSVPLYIFYPVLYSQEMKCHSVLLYPTASYYTLFLSLPFISLSLNLFFILILKSLTEVFHSFPRPHRQIQVSILN